MDVYMRMQLFIIKLIGLLGWLCSIALAQLELSETVTGSASFPNLGITCIGNLAVFFTSLYRGRLDLEMGARDVIATITGPKLENINGFGLSTCRVFEDASVVMLSTSTPNSSIRQFMRYISNAHEVESILLQCMPIKSEAVTADICDFECECNAVRCGCIVFSTVEEITTMLARRIPGTLKRLSYSLCLLPSLNCLRNGCHGCNQGLLLVENGQRLTEGDPMVETPATICGTLNYISQASMEEERICICIPVPSAERDDEWTNMLLRSFMLKENEARGVRVTVMDLDSQEIVEYSNSSLIVPRIIEVFVNLFLTGWFRVDGFSSSLISRRALRDYVVDSTGSGFAANAFLTKALVNSNGANNDVCQVLSFRGTVVSIRTFSFMVGCVNLICSIIWALLIALGGGAGRWYDSQSMPPSKPRVAVIMAAMGTGLVMDCLDLFSLYKRISGRHNLGMGIKKRRLVMFWVMIVMEILCIVSFVAVACTLGAKGFGRWLYSFLHCLVWVKWGIGSYLLGEFSQEFDSRRHRWRTDGTIVVASSDNYNVIGNRFESGNLVYSSAFLLNAILAGVRCKWKYLPEDN